jgi:hypothetical protein
MEVDQSTTDEEKQSIDGALLTAGERAAGNFHDFSMQIDPG